MPHEQKLWVHNFLDAQASLVLIVALSHNLAPSKADYFDMTTDQLKQLLDPFLKKNKKKMEAVA